MCAKLNNLLHVPFEFESKGSHILYYEPEAYEIAESNTDEE